MIKLIPVDPDRDWEFLYFVLELRLGEPNSNISHREMPTTDGHRAFLASKPYLGHYIVMDDKNQIGVCYITHKHEVGIWLRRHCRRMGMGRRVLKLLMDKHPGPLYANINPKNNASIQFFKRMGFQALQFTLEYQPEVTNEEI